MPSELIELTITPTDQCSLIETWVLANLDNESIERFRELHTNNDTIHDALFAAILNQQVINILKLYVEANPANE